VISFATSQNRTWRHEVDVARRYARSLRLRQRPD
jgi:hypothetical protein